MTHIIWGMSQVCWACDGTGNQKDYERDKDGRVKWYENKQRGRYAKGVYIDCIICKGTGTFQKEEK
jgi:RecJ-like exonuclease